MKCKNYREIRYGIKYQDYGSGLTARRFSFDTCILLRIYLNFKISYIGRAKQGDTL